MSLWSRIQYLIERMFGDAPDPKLSKFEQDYQTAFHNEWFCSTWGTSKYYIDDKNNMYVGHGELKGRWCDIVGGKYARSLRTINFMESVVAPVDSSYLFAEPESIYTSEEDFLHAVHGLDKIDTSHVTDMNHMFANDCFLKTLDLSSWDTSQVQDISFMFYHLSSLQDIDLADWDTRHIINMRGAFNGAIALSDLNLSHWKTPHVTDMSWMFTNDKSLNNLDLSHFSISPVRDTSAMFLAINDGAIIELSPLDKKRRLSSAKNESPQHIQAHERK